jgi:hypothetical protein
MTDERPLRLINDAIERVKADKPEAHEVEVALQVCTDLLTAAGMMRDIIAGSQGERVRS